ncbi:MATE family efflux transporter [Pseudonocardia asaccharolytica]|uniref:MATE family efflux transporter n=1 Tax=Pseudonocardia asaccharolytica DSM 44247 = NBRC 16224 TaxID=1123024 RepID=A0A511CZ82_9PSEU|nr:MATE family efflux transporter [Pseudonocardia asaccharolytica]GEL17851.1 MATE family efflux transporter [Pseudonocardia asaccharolytica DSM 44247 = NBRC 16224]
MSAAGSAAAGPVSARAVLRLAAPALPVLAAEPLYLLVDTAVVGRLGAVPLAGLAVAAVIFAQVTTQLTFLSYGTTARAARLQGAGRRSAAVAEGVQATWLAMAVGLVVLVVGQLVARPVAGVLGDGGAVADAAVSWLRIALFGAPLVLVTLAGNGWMRGVQDTARPMRYVLAGNGLSALACPFLVHGAGSWQGWGLEGSAVANVLAQTVVAGLFLAALWRERAAAPPDQPVRLRPELRLLRAQLGLGRDLVLRSLSFQACFLSATAVAARFGAPSVAAHQIVLQLWVFQALVLDAVAIAAQALVGAALGAGGADRARALARQVARYGLYLGVGFGILFAALSTTLPAAFTSDAAVLALVPVAWWFFAAMQPVAGVVFALDGVLLGAGDAAFLRNSTLLAAGLGFLPLIWVSLLAGWGLAGIWTGLTAFMLIRLAAVTLRTRSGRWAVTGVNVAHPA